MCSRSPCCIYSRNLYQISSPCSHNVTSSVNKRVKKNVFSFHLRLSLVDPASLGCFCIRKNRTHFDLHLCKYNPCVLLGLCMGFVGVVLNVKQFYREMCSCLGRFCSAGSPGNHF